MSYGALVLQVLISSPSDLPGDHRSQMHQSVRGWNATHGKFYGIHFSPVDGNESVSPDFGAYAQAVVNDQIVGASDVCIAIFTDRLGTATPGGYPSGTAEEVAEALAAGKEVAILRNNVARPPQTGTAAAGQRAELERYLEEQGQKAFISQYHSEAELRSVLERLLSRVAAKYREEVDPTPAAAPVMEVGGNDADSAESSGIWPRIEASESVEVDSRGRLKTRRKKKLVLESDLTYPAANVRYRYENSEGQPEEMFSLRTEEGVLAEILPPRGSVSAPVLQVLGSPSSAICVVTWEDPRGGEHSTRATVRG